MATTLQSPGRRLLLLGVLLAGGSAGAASACAPSPGELQDAFTGRGLLGAVAFAALYAVLAVALVPGSALTIAAGVVYGPLVGTLLSIAGALAGATAAIAVARRTARGSMQDERVARVQQRLREHGLPSILALRLVPLVPFNVLQRRPGVS